MKKVIAAVLVVMMISAMLFASTRALFIKHYSFDSIYVNDLENPVVNNGLAGEWAAENPIEGDIENLRVRGWAWVEDAAIVSFGYQIDDGEIILSQDFIFDRPDVQGAFGVSADVANGFDITMFVGDEAQGTHLVTLFVAGDDGSIEVITSFEFTQGYNEPIVPETPNEPALSGDNYVIHNPENTMAVWRNTEEFAISWDTLYINGVSQMELGWGGDGSAAYKLEENQPVYAGDIDTFTIRGWAGLRDGDVAEWGYRINGGENVYDADFTKPTEDAVIGAGGDSRFEIVVPVNRPTDPVLITAVAKDENGNEYDFIQFSLNGQYESGGVVNPPTGDDDQWLCGYEPEPYSIAPCWWFNPVGEPDDRFLDIYFYSNINFNGIRGFYYCSNPEEQPELATAVMTVQLLKNEEVLFEGEITGCGDDWYDTDFDKVFGQGEYILRFVCKSGSGIANNCWFILGAGDPAGDVYVDTNVPCSGGGNPAIKLKYTEEEPYHIEVSVSVDMIQANESVAGAAENLVYGGDIAIDPGDKLYIVGWAFADDGAPLEKIIYSIDGMRYECSDVYRDRPDVYAAFGDVVPEEGRNAGFGTDAEMIELLGIDELEEGFYDLGLIAVFEDGEEVEVQSYRLIVGDVRRWLAEPVDGILNIIVDGGTKMNEARRGETVDVKVELVNNPGICSLRAELYWSEYLKLKNAEYDIYGENEKYELVNEPDEYDYFEGATWEDVGNEFVFNWINANGVCEGDKTYVTLTFEVSEDAPLGEFLYIDAAVDGIDVFEDLGKDVDFTVIGGGVDVIPDPGDVDCDGHISNRDVVMLFRYVSGDSFRLIKKAADVTGDTEINNKDVVELFRMSSALDR